MAIDTNYEIKVGDKLIANNNFDEQGFITNYNEDARAGFIITSVDPHGHSCQVIRIDNKPITNGATYWTLTKSEIIKYYDFYPIVQPIQYNRLNFL